MSIIIIVVPQVSDSVLNIHSKYSINIYWMIEWIPVIIVKQNYILGR